MDRWTVFYPRTFDPQGKRPLGCVRARSAAEAQRIGTEKFESVVRVQRGCAPFPIAGVAAVVGTLVGVPVLLALAWKRSKR